MAHYVDGFLFAVALNKAKDYQKLARRASKIWIEHGALDYKECMGDDLNTGDVAVSFAKIMATTKKETVFFSYIVYRNKKHRDAVNKKVMADPRIAQMMKEKPPIDYSRMVYGGFRAVVDVQGAKGK